MKNWNKVIIVIGFATSLSLLAGSGCGSTSLRSLPDISFTTIKGKKITQDQLQGHPVLVTFWATDCGPCMEEIPDLIALHNEFAANGLIVVAIAMYYDPPNQVINMAEKKKLPYAIVLDPQAKTSQAFGQIQWTPTNFLFAPNGKLALRNRGVFDKKSIRDEIRELLITGLKSNVVAKSASLGNYRQKSSTIGKRIHEIAISSINNEAKLAMWR